MKKLGFLALALSLSVYSLGCGETKKPETPATPPAGGETAPAGEGTPAAGETHTEGDGHTAEEHAAEGAATTPEKAPE